MTERFDATDDAYQEQIERCVSEHLVSLFDPDVLLPSSVRRSVHSFPHYPRRLGSIHRHMRPIDDSLKSDR